MVKIRFVDAVLHGLKPRKIRYDVHDSENTGLLLRVSPQGRKTWMVNYRSETGVKQQRALGKFPAMASPRRAKPHTWPSTSRRTRARQRTRPEAGARPSRFAGPAGASASAAGEPAAAIPSRAPP